MVVLQHHKDELTKAGIFRQNDLVVNRLGHLSDYQKKLLNKRLIFWLGFAGLYFVLMFAFIYFQVSRQGNFLFGLAGITYLLFLISSCLEKAKSYREDLQGDRLRTATGRLHKIHGVGSGGYHRGSRVGYLHIRVKDEVFQASAITYHHMHEDGLYRIYFVENTRKIMNIEPL